MEWKFNTQKTGRTIAALRRGRNMTQMQLADEMGVSFQAVSNWERGQSMPDISKLPELATLFEVSIDELLGSSSPLLEQAAGGTLTEYLTENRVTEEEAAQAAPLLPPEQFDRVADHLMEGGALPSLPELLPFLSTSKVDQIVRQRLQEGQSIADCAPFASDTVLAEAAYAMEDAGQSCVCIAPFLSERAVNSIAEARRKSGKGFVELAPFMSSSAISSLAKELEMQGQSCVAIAPFLPEASLEEIVIARLRLGRKVTELLPFIGSRLLNRLAGTEPQETT